MKKVLSLFLLIALIGAPCHLNAADPASPTNYKTLAGEWCAAGLIAFGTLFMLSSLTRKADDAAPPFELNAVNPAFRPGPAQPIRKVERTPEEETQYRLQKARELEKQLDRMNAELYSPAHKEEMLKVAEQYLEEVWMLAQNGTDTEAIEKRTLWIQSTFPGRLQSDPDSRNFDRRWKLNAMANLIKIELKARKRSMEAF